MRSDKVFGLENSDTMLADLFELNVGFKQVRRLMYINNDVYTRIPKLPFIFENSVNPLIYEKIRNCIKSFKGNLSWELQYPSTGRIHKGKLYILLPKRIYNIYLSENKNSDSHCASCNSETVFLGAEYKKICDLAIADIPALTNHIKQCMNW